MPDISWNKSTWDSQYKWDLRGEEWSQAWGSSEAQWFGSLYPRIHRFVHAQNVLEIACGFGRWTKFLKNYVLDDFFAVDLSSECIEYCRTTFHSENISFFQNDGLSLDFAKGKKFDFVFSFDSLVHVNINVLDHYIKQILELLSPNGICFIHHTNFKSLLNAGMLKKGDMAFKHMRDQSTSAEFVKHSVLKHGGKLIGQEIVDWGGVDNLDCLTSFTRSVDHSDIDPFFIENNNFMAEAEMIRLAHDRYCLSK